MEIVAAYLLNQINGREVTKENIMKLLKIAGSTANEESVKLFMEKLNGKTHEEIMQEGATKMAETAMASAPAGGASNAAAAERKAPVEEEESEEECLDMF